MRVKAALFIALLVMLQILVLTAPTLSIEESTSDTVEHSTLSDLQEAVMMIDKEAYSIGDGVPITVQDPSANSDPNNVESVNVRAISMTDTEGLLIELLEDEPNTGIFKGILFLTDEETSRGNTLRVSAGERFTISYNKLNLTGLVLNKNTQSTEYDLSMIYLELIIIGAVASGAFFGIRHFFLRKASINPNVQRTSYNEYLLFSRSSNNSSL